MREMREGVWEGRRGRGKTCRKSVCVWGVSIGCEAGDAVGGRGERNRYRGGTAGLRLGGAWGARAQRTRRVRMPAVFRPLRMECVNSSERPRSPLVCVYPVQPWTWPFMMLSPGYSLTSLHTRARRQR